MLPSCYFEKKTILFWERNLAFESKNWKKTRNQTKLGTNHAFSKDSSGECPLIPTAWNPILSEPESCLLVHLR